jgi:hypothetical protein
MSKFVPVVLITLFLLAGTTFAGIVVCGHYYRFMHGEGLADIGPIDAGEDPHNPTTIKEAEADLNMVWHVLPPAVKKSLLPSQREWVKAKDAVPAGERVGYIISRIHYLQSFSDSN